ncbi:MAG: GNAT family N-acetyltransferase [Chloroflexi bacterium]|nr:GNAT family N-acetyltransferase [Chloroflexota bacterium]MDA1010429.1 GNAT family N-acetyltransferase [Chloroflexota bacterium]
MSVARPRTAASRGVWTRHLGVSLVAVDRERIAAQPAVARALTDGVERSWEAVMPPETPGQWYEARERGATVGVAFVRRDYPAAGQGALLAVATAPEARGRAVSTKVVLAVERKLDAEGYAPMLVRVPRTNGRGLYFMLRCGFTPVPGDHRPEDPGDATWFARLRDRPRLV